MSPPLHRGSSVCALIPHYECQTWLSGAIESLLEQTRPLDKIVVIDDASQEPPVDVVRRYPGVTLLRAPDNGGPYRLVQAVLEATDYDAYLFQDADDWSARDRLEVLLATAEETGAELVGSHEVRVLVDQADMQPVRYPQDVNQVLTEKPGAFPLLHPTSIVSRRLVDSVGGFASGMRFSGDAEFLRRAAHVARVVNADHFGYFRRKRSGSLTMSPDTGYTSPARRQVHAVLTERALANAKAVREGGAPDLAPWRRAPLPPLELLTGPPITDRARPRRAAAPSVPEHRSSPTGPVIVVGPRSSGDRLLTWSLHQHAALQAVPDPAWLALTAVDAVYRATREEAPAPPGYIEHQARALALSATGGRAGSWVVSGRHATEAAWALARLFPTARFLFVHRPAEDSVRALLAAPTDESSFYTPELAHRQWMTAVRVGLDLETVLGRGRVLRVAYDDLVGRPETELRRVLDFLGVPFETACARAIHGLAPTPPDAGDPRDDATRPSPRMAREVTELTARLLQWAADHDATSAALARLSSTVERGLGSGGSLVEKVREAVARTVPEGAVVAVVSRGDPALLGLAGTVGWHLPQVEGGTYAGYHPAGSDEVVTQLEELRARGADYLLIPATSLWWLSYYAGLRAHLNERCELASFHEDAGAIYRLTDHSTASHRRLRPRWVVLDDQEDP